MDVADGAPHPVAGPDAPIVFVVDDDAAVRESTVLFLVHRGWTVRAFDSAEAFLAAWEPDAVGCLLLDLRMPGMSGLELQAVLAERGSDLPIVFLTGHGDVQQTVMALKRGAVDFLEKPWNHATLERLVGETVAAHVAVARRRRSVSDVELRRRELTVRESEVLGLLVAGRTSKHIGRELGISHRTVEAHRANLMRKMGVGSLAELLALLTAG